MNTLSLGLFEDVGMELRVLRLLAVGVFLALLLTACGGGGGGNTPASQNDKPASGETVINGRA